MGFMWWEDVGAQGQMPAREKQQRTDSTSCRCQDWEPIELDQGGHEDHISNLLMASLEPFAEVMHKLTMEINISDPFDPTAHQKGAIQVEGEVEKGGEGDNF